MCQHTVQRGRGDWPCRLAFSGNSSVLAIAGSGRFYRRSAHIGSGTFSFKAEEVLRAAEKGTMQLCEAATGAILKTCKHLSPGEMNVEAIAFTCKDRAVVSVSDAGTVSIIPLTHLSDPIEAENKISVNYVLQPPQVSQLLGINELAWNQDWQKNVSHTAPFDAIISPTGDMIAMKTPSDPSILHISRANDGSDLQIRKYESPLDDAAFSYDNKYIAAIARGSVEVYELHSGAVIWKQDSLLCSGIARPWSSLAFSPNGRLLAGIAKLPSRIILYAAATGVVLATKALGSRSQSLAFSPDSKFVAIGDDEGSVALWDLTTNIDPALLNSGLNFNVDINIFQGNTVGVRSGRSMRLLNSEGQMFASFTAPVRHSLDSFSKDGKVAATIYGKEAATICSKDCRVEIWDVVSGCKVQSLRPFGGNCILWWRSVLFGDNDIVAIHDSKTRAVEVWRLKSGACLQTLPNVVQALALSLDNVFVYNSAASPFSGKLPTYQPFDLQVFDLHKGCHILQRNLSQRKFDFLAFHRADFSPDGKLLAVSSNLGSFGDNLVELWDVRNGVLLEEIQPARSKLDLRFHESGDWLEDSNGYRHSLYLEERRRSSPKWCPKIVIRDGWIVRNGRKELCLPIGHELGTVNGSIAIFSLDRVDLVLVYFRDPRENCPGTEYMPAQKADDWSSNGSSTKEDQVLQPA